MADSEKVSAIYNYLEKEFDSWSITESYESGRKAHVFKIQSGSSRHTAVIRDDFFEKQDVQSIADTLKRFLLAEHLRECDFPIVVTPTGLSD